MKGIIIVNAYSTLASSLNQSVRLKEEFAKLGVDVDIQTNDYLYAMIDGGNLSVGLCDVDFVVYLDKDKYVLQMLEMCGVKVFNSCQSILICDDKMQTHLALCNKGIDMPITIPGLLCYSENAQIKLSVVEKLENILHYPIIIKECYGSLGKGVYKADNRAELLDIMENVKNRQHFFQQLVTTSYGRDVRVICIGGKVVCSMLRSSNDDFRSNVELGGVGTNYVLNDEFTAFAEKVATTLNLDYCGIDILFGDGGKPVLCEVNSNAFFGGIESVSGVNVAMAYADYIVNSLSK